MTDVLVVLKVYPDSDEIDLDQLANTIGGKLPEGYSVMRKDTEPIAFGLKALVLYIKMPEQTEGGTDTLEEIASNVEGVSHAEVVGVTRLGF
ncbi:elongation factor 1-beta [Acidianus manzaensis]|uniref:Elongation factor 1-beta n=1 Tax=Acidianus manzaensis TaxID=282676 RepID=A0A1W6K0M6_9CREN|nr:elongation factor 1-beta [Acidianus manzaensis]ARM75994.1 elongation factor 1-beta [Acidianus manzaensis]